MLKLLFIKAGSSVSCPVSEIFLTSLGVYHSLAKKGTWKFDLPNACLNGLLGLFNPHPMCFLFSTITYLILLQAHIPLARATRIYILLHLTPCLTIHSLTNRVVPQVFA